MKKLLMIVALATLGATAMAVPPDLQPPVTTGGNGTTSSTEVRITANVVDGIAVNEASPIDFGNLVRGSVDSGIVNQNIPGKISIKAAPGTEGIQVSLDKVKTDLVWTGANGTDQTNEGTKDKTTITDVTVHGLTVAPTPVNIGPTGVETKILTASFTAGNTATANLGLNQKLGSYVGTILVTATKASI